MVDGTGTTSYTYYPVTTGGTLGAAEVQSVTSPLPTARFTGDLMTYE